MGNIKTVLKDRRLAAQLSQKEIAEKINITQAGYSKMENGDIIPSLKTFSKLAAILDIDMNILKPNYKQAEWGGEVMNEEYKKILEQQLQLLSERSKSANNEDLCKLTDKMINLIMILDPELQNRFSVAQSLHFPALATLSAQDLIDLHLGQYAREDHLEIFRKKPKD